MEKNSTQNNCSGKSPLISIAVAVWICVIASLFFLYLYWRYIYLKTSAYILQWDQLRMQEINEDSGKDSDHTTIKELEEHYQTLTRHAKNEDVYQALDTEEYTRNRDSVHAQDILTEELYGIIQDTETEIQAV